MVQPEYTPVARSDEGEVGNLTSEDREDLSESESQKEDSTAAHEVDPSQNTSKEPQTHVGHQTRFWNPPWLSQISLFCFSTVFLILALTIAALYVASRRNSGLSTQSSSHQYAWTYGPTAVIVLVSSFWLHIEYWCKELTPWSRMRNAASPVKQGILSDYFTPNILVTLWKSFRQKDFAVWLAVCSGLILQGTVVLATSLILLEPTLVNRTTQLNVSKSLVSTAPNLTTAGSDGDPLVVYYGIQTKNLPYPAGTTENLTVESILPQDGSLDNTSYSGTVSGISVNLDCEPITLSNVTRRVSQPWSSVLAPFYSVNVTTPDCRINGVLIGEGVSHDPEYTDTTSVFQGWWSNYTCNDGVQNDDYPLRHLSSGEDRPIVPGFDDHRLIMTTSFIQWTANATGALSRQTWVQNFSMIMCKPSYAVLDYKVTQSHDTAASRSPRLASRNNDTGRKVDGFSDDDLVPLLKTVVGYSSLKNAAEELDVSIGGSASGYLRADDPFWIVMSKMTGPAGLRALSDQSTLLEVGPRAFSGVLAQVFQQYFTSSSGRQITGDVQTCENRLNVKEIPAVAMIALLGVLACISTALAFLRPANSVPCKPDTIAAKAKILAASPALSRDMQSCGGGDRQGVASKLRNLCYRSVVNEQDSSFQILPQGRSLSLMEQASSIGPHKTSKWWKPINHQIWFGILLVATSASIVAVLEILQHRSNSENGILEFSDLGSAHIWINLIPATVLTGLGMLFSSLHSDTTIAAPYNALGKKAVSHAQGVTVSILGKTSPHVFLLALKHRLFVVCFSAVGVMVASFLTIIVSSLYRIEEITVLSQLQIQRTDSFNFTKQDLYVFDNQAGGVTKLIYLQNLTYPVWTYGNLAFPTMSIEKAAGMSDNSSLTVEVPAIRPSLECYMSTPDQMTTPRNISFYGLQSYGETYFNSTMDLLCPSGNGSICLMPWNLWVSIPSTASNSIIGGAYSIVNPYVQQNDNTLQMGYPAFVMALGKVSTRVINNTTFTITDHDMHAFVCYQHLQEVQTKVVLDMPGMNISTSSPPVVMESTAKDLIFSSSNYTGTRYTNSIQTLLDSLDPKDYPWWGGFIDTLINGKDGSDVNTFLGSQGAPYIVAAAQELYATYMVQAIDANFRVPEATNAPAITYQGTLSQPNSNRQRLRQDPKTKIALQVMLLVMVLCALLTFILSDWKTALPCPPSSIAGTMILLAGSDMASRTVIPEGSEWNDDVSLWEGWQFSLGWWGDSDGRRFGVDVGNSERQQ